MVIILLVEQCGRVEGGGVVNGGHGCGHVRLARHGKVHGMLKLLQIFQIDILWQYYLITLMH